MLDAHDNAYLVVGPAALLVFIVVYSVVASRKVRTYEDFAIAGRGVSVVPLVLTMMGTAIGGSTVLGFSTSGYTLGIGRSWEIIPAYLVFVFIIVLMLRAIRNVGIRHSLITIPDYVALRYGERGRLPATLSILIAYAALTGIQYTAIAGFLHVVAGIDIRVGILIGWLVLTAKTCLGGLKAVIRSDVIQGFIQNVGILIVLGGLLVFAGGARGSSQAVAAIGDGDFLNPFSMPVGEVAVFALTLGGYQIVRQDVWQRIWAAKDTGAATRAFSYATVFAFVLTMGVFAIGSFGRLAGVHVENPALAFYAISSEILPGPLLAVVVTALIATIVSAADSNLVAGASSVVNDILKPALRLTDDRQLLRYGRYSVVITSTAALLLALYIPRLVELWVTGSAMLTSGLLAPVIAAFFWRRATRTAGVTAIWGGLTAAVTWQVIGHPFGVHPVLVGLPTSIALIVVVSLLDRRATDPVAEQLLYRSNRSPAT
ncbi:MAG: sodium:solute symporter family protein [Spirochaetaceae bacterium]|nr:MAG: sodium:solute symporter family protein [Spirochaetaceae bacterium]